MARLVPGSDEACKGACGKTGTANAIPLAEEEEGGCGSSAGRTVGSDMASVEAQLAQNERAEENNLELEITSPKPTNNGTKAIAQAPKQPKRISRGITPKKKQVMGQCQKCGYLSSQQICKACVLLEGLNKARPKNQIEVSYDVQDLQQRDQGVDGVVDTLQRTRIGGD